MELVDGAAIAARAALLAALEQLKPREIAAGMSLAGPHRDDLTFMVNYIDVTAFGSRGQQRTATLALTNATVPYVMQLAKKGWKKALRENDALAKGLNVVDKKVVYKAVADAFGMPFVEPATYLED